MKKGRLEAFSDGVIAIIITIMVLELKIPKGEDFASLLPLAPVFLTYVLSFLYVGIYWNNHHHLLQACNRVTGSILWANLHLLFWLSLFPFATGWMGGNHFATAPTVFYGLVLFMAAISYWILQKTILLAEGDHSVLGQALGQDLKGKLSPLFYITAILISFWSNFIAQLLFLAVALIWLAPDPRIERALRQKSEPS